MFCILIHMQPEPANLNIFIVTIPYVKMFVLFWFVNSYDYLHCLKATTWSWIWKFAFF